ncbi:uncharacterized protein LOC133690803 [Populus nigra]|uniref:uncharacterized protein LOC133690803 n=1 Tax=Populus nigra TaxID=3691 RepID=UPI002B2667E3|nr:uncharacterized protein LOC133690803 [Populus nigra]
MVTPPPLHPREIERGRRTIETKRLRECERQRELRCGGAEFDYGFGVYVRNPNLQQWFEYCSSEKKCSCPVCKQNCSAQDGGRLYSHSVGDQTEPLGDRKPGDEEDSELLRGEVERLEGIFLVLNTILERQVKEIKQLNEELYLCKDELKRQVKSMIDSMEQKASILHLIRLKSEELDALKLESIRLHDRNVALTKELVALKLVSDVNLEEDEVLKPASFGIEANNKDTVDIIRKSVVILIRFGYLT